MSYTFDKPVEELIKIRHSVRNYDNNHLSQEIINKTKGDYKNV